MALTPEDVVTKQFQHVRFKEGFDPDEVDDFLDEIVVEWRKVIAEKKRPDDFRLRRASFKGKGLQPQVQGADWERIRDMAYEGRGG